MEWCGISCKSEGKNASTKGREKRDKMVVFLNLCGVDGITLGGRGARYQSGQI